MGPEGGRKGGKVLYAGTPEQMLSAGAASFTAPFLENELKNKLSYEESDCND